MKQSKKVAGAGKWCWEDKFFVFFLLGTFGVYTYHLGIMPMLDDESTRALVSLEMVLSRDYLVPTTHGLLYQNKPPLFNWIVALLMESVPEFNEFVLRFPSMVAFLLTALVVYLFLRKELSSKTALISAVGYLTCGRILFYDSMLGYIDPFFTLTLVLNVIFLFQITKKERSIGWLIGSYILCFLAFMFKGLPAIVFQVFTILVSFSISRRWKSFFSWGHLLGVLVFVVPLMIYYLAYSKNQDVFRLFETLMQQSTSRTVSHFSLTESVLHILTFPLQFIFHFLPWTLFAIVLFHKRIWRFIRSHPLLWFLNCVVCVNIIVYWLSPDTRPRYLFVFLPFFLAIAVECYWNLGSIRALKVGFWTVFLLSLGCGIAVLVPLFIPRLAQIDHAVWISMSCCLLIAILSIAVWRMKMRSFAFFASILLCLRFAFNHFLLPLRQQEAPESEYKRVGKRIGELTQVDGVYLLPGTSIDHDIAYYISSTNRRILSYANDSLPKGSYVIGSKDMMEYLRLSPEFAFSTNFQNATLYFAKYP